MKSTLWLIPLLTLGLSLLLGSQTLWAKTVRYELTVTQKVVNLSGKAEVDWALAVNDTIPAPTLEFVEGDEAEIVLHNTLKEEVSVHWHGILLPPEMDGVAYVNTPPIHPGQTFTYRFKLRQHGTYWYHSHTMLQEQKGIYGGIIVHPREPKIAVDQDLVVILSDWSDENPDQILKNLRKDGDYYLYKKQAIRSWFGAMEAGALGTFLHNEWVRMGGMDLSDVGYDAFLINGKRDSQLWVGKPGQRVRIRVINAAASTYFHLALGQAPMQLIAADGMDLKALRTKEILIGMAETYDLLFEIPQGSNTELRATAQDGSGYASAWIGSGEKVAAPQKAPPPLYGAMDHSQMKHEALDHSRMKHEAMDHSQMKHEAMDHSKMNHGAMDHSKMNHGAMDHSKMKHGSHGESPALDLVTVDKLQSPVPTAFAKDHPTYELKLVLGGDMERYVWHINGKAIFEERNIQVKEGDVVRFVFENETMMHHPMHLHGHFFRVLNEAGDYSPLKHTVDVPPHGTRTIEFLANEPGQWMLHCHNLYHMKTGMARVIQYQSFQPSPEMAQHEKHDPHRHEHIYVSGSLTAATDHAGAELKLSRTWDSLSLELEQEDFKEPSARRAELWYRRWQSNYLSLVLGGAYEDEREQHKERARIGVGYTLPFLVESTLLVDQHGDLRLDLAKHLQWTSSVFSELELRVQDKTDLSFSLLYGPSWSWAVGLMIHNDQASLGGRYRF